MTTPMDLDALDALLAKLSPGPWLIDERKTPETNAHWGIMVRPLTDEEWAADRKRWAEYQSMACIRRATDENYVQQITDPDDDERPLACMVVDDCASQMDLRFMAEARQAVPALVAEVRRLRIVASDLLIELQKTCRHPVSIDSMPAFCGICGKVFP